MHNNCKSGEGKAAIVPLNSSDQFQCALSHLSLLVLNREIFDDNSYPIQNIYLYVYKDTIARPFALLLELKTCQSLRQCSFTFSISANAALHVLHFEQLFKKKSDFIHPIILFINFYLQSQQLHPPILIITINK